jgi:hypothetical protein
MRETDLVRPKYNSKTKLASWDTHFEMFYVEDWGWCIPTLLIKKASRAARDRGVASDRYYATRVDTGELVRIGHGPHVLRTVRVIVKESRLKGLARFLDLKAAGAIDANKARDNRSTNLRRSRKAKLWSF